MAVPIAVPKLGMTMEEATIVRWLKGNGEPVRRAEVILEVETEKATFEVEAPADGFLHIVAEEGEVHPVGGLVGYVLAEGEGPPDLTSDPNSGVRGGPVGTGSEVTTAGSETPAAEVRASGAARRLARSLGVDLQNVKGTGPGGRIREIDVEAFAKVNAATLELGGRPSGDAAFVGEGSTKAPGATPLARRVAARLGVDVQEVEGTGHRGRVMRADVEAYAASLARQPIRNREDVRMPLRGMRRTIAERMHRSLREMAQLTITMKVDMTEATRLRQWLLDEWGAGGPRLTYTDLVIKACAKALQEHPVVNAHVEGDEIIQRGAVNIGLAVALEDGLVVPVIHHVDRLSIREIAKRSSELVDAARSRRLSAEMISGGTFTVTTLGAYDVEFFTPIVNPPEVAILGVGKIEEVVVLDEGHVAERPIMRLSLSFDHRALDGAPAAQFLQRVVRLLERPYLLLT